MFLPQPTYEIGVGVFWKYFRIDFIYYFAQGTKLIYLIFAEILSILPLPALSPSCSPSSPDYLIDELDFTIANTNNLQRIVSP